MPDISTAIYHSYLAHAAVVAVQLRLPEQLQDGPKAVDELTEILSCEREPLLQLLRILETYDYLEKTDGEKYALTNLSRSLIKTREDSFLNEYIHFVGGIVYPTINRLYEIVKTGEFLKNSDGPGWSVLREDRRLGEIVENHMDSVTRWHAAAIVEVLDCSHARTVVDVGGGHASLATALLKRNPHLSAVILDQPHNRERACRRLEAEGLDGRCEFVGGDFFESVPEGGDLYTIKHVIHDWTDGDALKILRNIRRAMPAASELVIIEGVMENGVKDPAWMGARNLEQYITGGGHVRTRGEFVTLLAHAGLALDRTVQSAIGDCTLIYAKPF